MKKTRITAVLSLVGVAMAALSVYPSSAAPQAQAADIAALVNRIDLQRLYDHIDAIDEPRNAFAQPEALQAAAGYVEGQLTGFGYDVTLDPVTVDSMTFPNVIGVHEGTTCPERVFVAGAHYDSVADTPGADDNASGVAGMLEIARALADTPLPATVWFTGFTMEEPTYPFPPWQPWGSVHMAQEEAAAGTPIVGMYSLEMIGYTTPEADFIIGLGNEASVRLVEAFERAVDSYVTELPYGAIMVSGNGGEIEGDRWSDHAPFWDAGYQALMVTDTAGFRNPNYHEPTDTIDTLDLPFATNVTKAMLATTVDYLTHDGDGDGQPDACSGPLAATATPTPTITATPSDTVTPTPTPLPVDGIAALPEVGRRRLDAPESTAGGYPTVAVLVGIGAAAAVLGAAGWALRRRR